MLRLAFLSLSIVCLSGCFSLETAWLDRNGEEHVVVSNYGWSLFHFIPLACGNAADDATLPFVFFRNDVTMENVQRRFFAHAGARSVRDLTYISDESVLFPVPVLGFQLPIPYLLTYRGLQLSGLVCPSVPQRKGGAE